MAARKKITTRSTGRQPDRPGSGRRESVWGEVSDRLDDWLAIEPDGAVTALSGKVELGTGVKTALAQIVAEELDVPLERVHMVMGDTARTPDEGYTAGSMTISGSGTALRKAAAEARRAMLKLAAERLDAATKELAVRDGVIFMIRHPEHSVTYAELMGGKRFGLRVTDRAPLKSPADYQIVGTSTPRADLPGKVAGQASFIHDFKLPGMLHARLVRPPNPAARLVAMDADSVKDVSGLVKVVRLRNFIGVVAEQEHQAILAAKQLKVEWEEKAAYPRMRDLYTALRDQPTQDTVLVDQGDFRRAIAGASRQLHSTYYQPFHAHASIGPSCAVAQVEGDQVTVWASPRGWQAGPRSVDPTGRVHLGTEIARHGDGGVCWTGWSGECCCLGLPRVVAVARCPGPLCRTTSDRSTDRREARPTIAFLLWRRAQRSNQLLFPSAARNRSLPG
jgi:nicotinate dehydrogenase subunit B